MILAANDDYINTIGAIYIIKEMDPKMCHPDTCKVLTMLEGIKLQFIKLGDVLSQDKYQRVMDEALDLITNKDM